MQTGIHNLIAHSLQVIRHLQPRSHKGTQLLIAHHIPNTVTRQHHKFILCIWPSNFEYFRLRWYKLLCGALALYTLVVIVTQCSGYSQRSINPLDHHRATCVLYTLLLPWVAGLMVQRGEADKSVAAEKGPRVTAVNEEQMFWRKQHSHRSGAAAVHAISQVCEAAHVFVDPQKAGADTLLHRFYDWCFRCRSSSLPQFICRPCGDDMFQQVFGAVVCNTRASMPIVDGEEGPVIQAMWQAYGCCVRILHLHPPSLHAAEAKAQAVPSPVRIVFLCFGLI